MPDNILDFNGGMNSRSRENGNGAIVLGVNTASVGDALSLQVQAPDIAGFMMYAVDEDGNKIGKFEAEDGARTCLSTTPELQVSEHVWHWLRRSDSHTLTCDNLLHLIPRRPLHTRQR